MDCKGMVCPEKGAKGLYVVMYVTVRFKNINDTR